MSCYGGSLDTLIEMTTSLSSIHPHYCSVVHLSTRHYETNAWQHSRVTDYYLSSRIFGEQSSLSHKRLVDRSIDRSVQALQVATQSIPT